MKDIDRKPKTIAQWRQFLDRFNETERWRTGEDDRTMKEVIPDIGLYHMEMRMVATIIRESIALLPKALEECENCQPSVPCADGCLAEAFLTIFGLHGKPKGDTTKTKEKNKMKGKK